MRLAEGSGLAVLTRNVLPPALFDTDLEGVGGEAKTLARRLVDATRHYRFPMTRQTAFEKFRALVSEWKEDTKFLSSTTAMTLHKAYQEIIGMGPLVIPLILRELETTPDQWFAALKALTGVDPVPPAE